eukprot:jgi/Mesen1/9943/ME000705S09081
MASMGALHQVTSLINAGTQAWTHVNAGTNSSWGPAPQSFDIGAYSKPSLLTAGKSKLRRAAYRWVSNASSKQRVVSNPLFPLLKQTPEAAIAPLSNSQALCQKISSVLKRGKSTAPAKCTAAVGSDSHRPQLHSRGSSSKPRSGNTCHATRGSFDAFSRGQCSATGNSLSQTGGSASMAAAANRTASLFSRAKGALARKESGRSQRSGGGLSRQDEPLPAGACASAALPAACEASARGGAAKSAFVRGGAPGGGGAVQQVKDRWSRFKTWVGGSESGEAKAPLRPGSCEARVRTGPGSGSGSGLGSGLGHSSSSSGINGTHEAFSGLGGEGGAALKPQQQQGDLGAAGGGEGEAEVGEDVMEEEDKEAILRTADLVIHMLDQRKGDEAHAHRSEVSALRRLQREAFADLLKARERIEKLEAHLGISKFAGGGAGGGETALGGGQPRTRLVGSVSAGAAYIPEEGERSKAAVDELEGSAGLRSGLGVNFRFETPCREADLLVTECVAGWGDHSRSAMLGGPVHLQKVLYTAALLESVLVKIAPLGVRGADVADSLNPLQGLTRVSSEGMPLHRDCQGAAAGVTLKGAGATLTAAQFVDNWGVPQGTDGAAGLSTSTLAQLTIQPHEGMTLACAGVSRYWPMPPLPGAGGSSSMHWSELGPLLVPKLGRGGGWRGAKAEAAPAGNGEGGKAATPPPAGMLTPPLTGSSPVAARRGSPLGGGASASASPDTITTSSNNNHSSSSAAADAGAAAGGTAGSGGPGTSTGTDLFAPEHFTPAGHAHGGGAADMLSGCSQQSLAVAGAFDLGGIATVAGWAQAEHSDWMDDSERQRMQWGVSVSRPPTQGAPVGFGLAAGTSRADMWHGVGDGESGGGEGGRGDAARMQVEGFLNIACGKGVTLQPGVVHTTDGRQGHSAFVLRSSWDL